MSNPSRSLNAWLDSLTQALTRKKDTRPRHRLRIEALEERVVLDGVPAHSHESGFTSPDHENSTHNEVSPSSPDPGAGDAYSAPPPYTPPDGGGYDMNYNGYDDTLTNPLPPEPGGPDDFDYEPPMPPLEPPPPLPEPGGPDDFDYEPPNPDPFPYVPPPPPNPLPGPGDPDDGDYAPPPPTQSNSAVIALDEEPVVRGRAATFWLTNGVDNFEYQDVAWDFDYDGTNFHTDARDPFNWGIEHAFGTFDPLPTS